MRIRLQTLLPGAAIAALLAIPAFAQEGTFDLPAGATPPSSGPAIDGLELVEVVSAAHEEGTIAYDRMPPAGGPHSPVWQNCGVYDAPVITEQAVHSQEHGAVWITYRPGLADADLARLERLADREQYLLVSPLPEQAEPLIASAWGAQLKLERADDPRLREFIRFYADTPDGPEPGAPCDGASAETLPMPAATPGTTSAATPAATPQP